MRAPGRLRPPRCDARAVSDRPGKLVADIYAGRLFDFGSNTTRLILERSETARAEVTYGQSRS